jgi:ribosome-binding factor A
MPELRFIHDDSFDEAARLDALIDAAPKGEDRDEDGDGTDGVSGDPVE